MGAESYLTLSCDTLEVTKRLRINLSQVCDDYLRQFVREAQERRWRQGGATFVAAYNQTLEAEGLPLEEWRSF